MSVNNIGPKTQIQEALLAFASSPLRDGALSLLRTMGYHSERTIPLAQASFDEFNKLCEQYNKAISPEKAMAGDWHCVDVLFQLTDGEIAQQQTLTSGTSSFHKETIRSYVFIAIDLKNADYLRRDLVKITREVNKPFGMPVLVLFRYNGKVTISIIDRRSNKKDSLKDVLEKVTLIKDIDLAQPHRAHIEILFDLSLEELMLATEIRNFDELHKAWQKTLDIKELNRKFYHELANWYFWATDHVSFPADTEKKTEVRNATSLIRLITRIVFIWFIKEKNLVPELIFEPMVLNRILKEFLKNRKSHSYYQAILQNLFFGTLNQKMDERKFAKDEDINVNKNEYGVKTLFRYQYLFNIPEKDVLAIFRIYPF